MYPIVTDRIYYIKTSECNMGWTKKMDDLYLKIVCISRSKNQGSGAITKVTKNKMCIYASLALLED